MKKTLLAIVIPAMLATSAQAVEILKTDTSVVDFYGQMRTRLLTQNEDGDFDHLNLTAGNSRMGVKASHQITEGLKAFAKVEFGMGGANDDNDYALENRLHYAGIKGDFGKLTFGRQWVVSDDTWGADYSYYFGGTALRHATLSGARHDSLIKYNGEVAGVWIAANVGLNEGDSEQELYEFYFGKKFGDLNLHAGAGYNVDATDTTTRDLENTYFEGTVEYTMGDAFVGFTYYNATLEDQDSGETIDENAFSFSGTYSLTKPLTVYGGVEYVDQSSDIDSSVDGDGLQVYVGAVHKFNAWSRVYVEAAFQDGTTLGFTDKGSDTLVAQTVKDSEFAGVVGYRVYW